VELRHYLDRWLEDPSVADYKVLYLAFHGSPSCLHITAESEPVSLRWLASRLDAQSAKDCVIVFGSCSVMRTDRSTLDEFLRATGTRALIGYDADVDWLPSAAMELLILGTLASHSYLGMRSRRLEDRSTRAWRSTFRWKSIPRPRDPVGRPASRDDNRRSPA
jgi:hypothetical protein